ncbi:MAG: right-handed parallel beta-helix repeat-containing protein [Acidobacteria bacterium]|nr:right-handed parallel beta-helix repeat-containing protein [Acidobacteriota bacterium]
MTRTVMFVGAAALVASLGTLQAQDHAHLSAASGIPHGIARVCAAPTVTSVANGAWSSPATWSAGRIPAADDAVRIAAGTDVTYDAVSGAALRCVDVEGRLAFRTDRSTRMTVATLTVLESGRLEIGTVEAPVAAGMTAEVVIADRRIDTAVDPEQMTGGLIGLGTVRMHGAAIAPTFVRLAAEPLAGQRALQLEEAASGWHAGDRLVLPDTRQLRQNERGTAYAPQWEELTVAAIDGRSVALTAPLAFDHRGARGEDGRVEFLPHVGNVSRNVVVRSENPQGTRGHVIFITRPDVDIRYALFKDLGRTRMGVLDNTEFAADGSVRHVGTNQIGRYSLHFHHAFGPRSPQANGHQFTLIGNAIDDASKWGITIHNSHYGLVQDNVVYNSRGAGIVAEDGTESFNAFEHNFAVRSEGSGEFAPRSGYGGATGDPGGEGAGFWLRGPNNILRNNVAANVDVFGYGIAAGALDTVRIPKFTGADPSRDGEFVTIDAVDTPVLEFTGNEAYGAIQTGVAIGWNGVLKDSRVWHASRNAVTAFPADRLVIDGFVARGDVSVLARAFETPTGVWFTNYAAKTVTVRHADIQGLRVGVASPFFPRIDTEPGRGDGVATIEDSYLRNYVGVAVATAYTPVTTLAPVKKAVVRNTRFAPLAADLPGQYPAAAISMNYGMSPGDAARRDPVVVYDFNATPGDTFRVFYSHEVPASAAPPCHTPRPQIGGFVCAGDDATQESRR